MKLACNWSAELEQLMNEESVRLDYIKAGAFGDYRSLFPELRELRPILLHGLGYDESTGMSGADTLNYPEINALLDFCGSPHLGIHLSVKRAELESAGDLTERGIYDRMRANIDIFKSNINVPLLVESTPDSDRDRDFYGHYPFHDPELITRIVSEAGIGFLFDLAHIRVTCAYNGFDEREYIKRLPLGLTRELHVNGYGHDSHGRVMDCHSAMTNDDFKLLEWVLERTSPEIITLEYGWYTESSYGAEKALLRDNLKRLAGIVYSNPST